MSKASSYTPEQPVRMTTEKKVEKSNAVLVTPGKEVFIKLVLFICMIICLLVVIFL